MEPENTNAQNESRLKNKPFITLISALVTLASLIVSAGQVWVAYITKDREITVTQQQGENKLKLTQLEMERRWNLDIAKFVAENQNLIFSEDKNQRETIRNVLVVTFPPDITDALFVRLQHSVPDEEQETWIEGQQVIAKLPKITVSLQYNSKKDDIIMNKLAKRLISSGYKISNVWVNKNQTKGDVRYFNHSDKSVGHEIESIVENFLKENGIIMDIALLYPKIFEGKVKPGTIEIWLPEIPENKTTKQ